MIKILRNAVNSQARKYLQAHNARNGTAKLTKEEQNKSQSQTIWETTRCRRSNSPSCSLTFSLSFSPPSRNLAPMVPDRDLLSLLIFSVNSVFDKLESPSLCSSPSMAEVSTCSAGGSSSSLIIISQSRENLIGKSGEVGEGLLVKFSTLQLFLY